MITKFNYIVIVLVFLIAKLNVFAQYSVTVKSYLKTPDEFSLLKLNNHQLASNDTNNQLVLDLVEASLVDSIIKRKREHHRVFLVGWIINQLGYGWRPVSFKREKFVGKIMRQSKSGAEQFTEFDVNFDLNFHLKKYLFKVFQAYDYQKKKGRQDYRRGKHLRNYNIEPFVRDTNNISSISNYRLHCEHTPYRPYRSILHQLFYPVLGSDMASHPNFKTNYPNVGIYGVYCLDCNHSCHPELHPYEWLWWLNLSKNDDDWNEKVWNIGLLHEGSNRFRYWSPKVRTGTIKIPFLFDPREANPEIYIEHMVVQKFISDSLKKHFVLGQEYFGCKEEVQTITIESNFKNINVLVKQNIPLQTDGLRYWLSDINMDPSSMLVSGYLNITTSVEEVYTTRITFKSKRHYE